jgi:hypothetical protein
MPTRVTASAANIYFSDFFNIDPAILDAYGAFNVSLINDLPLFIDPFLLFNSEKPEYRQLHNEMIQYLVFLRDNSDSGGISKGQLQAWYQFKEIRQNWLGFSQVGNRGSALGPQFGRALNANLGSIFHNFGSEQVTQGSHLEKVCIVAPGVGKDNISDFTTSLIHHFLLDYTVQFAKSNLRDDQRSSFPVSRAKFNYDTRTWETKTYELPRFDRDYVLLTPVDILTRDDTWISRADLLNTFDQIANSIPNEQLRFQLNQYLAEALSGREGETPKEREARVRRARAEAIARFPEIVEHYIREKEDTGDQAQSISAEKVRDTRSLLVDGVRDFVDTYLIGTEFYTGVLDSYEEAMRRVQFLKHVIEKQDAYRIFYVDGEPCRRESDLQYIFKFTLYASTFDFNAETNNGRGPADFAASMGSADKSLIEFKLASNSQLKSNLQKQTAVYEQASGARRSIKVICYFTSGELQRVEKILKELELQSDSSIVLIDARSDNKPSASKA